MIYPVVSIWREHPAVINGESVPIIGYKGGLPTRSDRDMSFFKAMTSHSICIVGRETFKSFPNGLSNRTCIVLTKNLDTALNLLDLEMEDTDNGAEYTCAFSIKDALKVAEEIIDESTEDGEKIQQRIYIIGGKSVYEQFMPYTDAIIQSIVSSEFVLNETTVFPPDWNKKGFTFLGAQSSDDDYVQLFVRPDWREGFESFVMGVFDASS